MRLLARHDHTVVRLVFDCYPPGPIHLRIAQLRGALAATFHDDNLFHQHDGRGGLVYRYPRVQYGWTHGCGLVSGWNEGADILREITWLDFGLEIAGRPVTIVDATILMSEAEFGISDKLERYVFATPLLPFNQKTYRCYQQMNPPDKSEEKDRLLVAQILTGLRGLNIEFTERLYASFVEVSPVGCHYKGQDLLGLRGEFLCNALLPSGFAIGHAVSHGFGRICRRADGALLR